MKDVIIIGAGLSGLTAANYLQQIGKTFTILEATDRVGGRVKTDKKEGFLLDHGFQVFSTAYPEAQVLLDYNALDLRSFLPGAMLLEEGGRRDRIGDPLRNWSSLFPTLSAKAGSLGSKLKVLPLKRRLSRKSVDEIFEAPEQPTAEVLTGEYGFDQSLAEHFFRPFYSGIFLEQELATSRRMFDFVFKMFSEGSVAVPNQGMEAIPRQLADNLPDDSIQLNCRVASIEKGTVSTVDAHTFEAKNVLIATEATALAQKYAPGSSPEYVSTVHLHFTTATAPIDQPLIALNTAQKRLANSIAVMDKIAPAYAPEGQHLLSISIVGHPGLSTDQMVQQVKAELSPWFNTDSWQFLDARTVKYALPRQEHVVHTRPLESFRLEQQLFICGDHMLNGSINGAMRSGRLAAKAIVELAS